MQLHSWRQLMVTTLALVVRLMAGDACSTMTESLCTDTVCS